MDIQLKRGLLDVCVLAAIKNEDSYGYKIIKDLKPYVELSESTLYTILKRLEAASMLTVRSAEHDGRLRKYYHITRAGVGRIEDFKNECLQINDPKVSSITNKFLSPDGKTYLKCDPICDGCSVHKKKCTNCLEGYFKVRNEGDYFFTFIL